MHFILKKIIIIIISVALLKINILLPNSVSFDGVDLNAIDHIHMQFHLNDTSYDLPDYDPIDVNEYTSDPVNTIDPSDYDHSWNAAYESRQQAQADEEQNYTHDLYTNENEIYFNQKHTKIDECNYKPSLDENDYRELQLEGNQQELLNEQKQLSIYIKSTKGAFDSLARERLEILNQIINDPTTRILHTVVQSSPLSALLQIKDLKKQVIDNVAEAQITHSSQVDAIEEKRTGLDVLRIAQNLYQNRPDQKLSNQVKTQTTYERLYIECKDKIIHKTDPLYSQHQNRLHAFEQFLKGIID